MPIAITLVVDDARGFDTRKFFPGSIPAYPDDFFASNPSEATARYQTDPGGPTYALNFKGSNFVANPSYGDFSGLMTSATLSEERPYPASSLPLAHLSIDFGETGVDALPLVSGYWFSPDNLMNFRFSASLGVQLSILGNVGADALHGSGRGDVLNGRGGADVLFGGGGNDVYAVDNVGDRVVEFGGEGADTVVSTISYSLEAGQSIETLQLSSATGGQALNLNGNEFVNTLHGNAGANTLNGRGGADSLRGLGGNDVYAVDNAGDLVVEAVNQGTDTVVSTISYVLAAGQSIEALQLASATGGQALNLTGNELANTLRGNAGNNVLNGGLGSDTLTGNAGADTFVFKATLGPANVDHITDFVASTATVHDTIQLSKGVFTALGTGALAASAFKDLATGSIDADDRILYDRTTGALSYDADGSAAPKAAVQFAVIDTKAALSFHDFLVVA